ncbi:MAG TPA: kelch repeat-containing protein [Chloroflexia bacterium]|nr:kelch repeat-containing protein [Chloroflexia bacterium]
MTYQPSPKAARRPSYALPTFVVALLAGLLTLLSGQPARTDAQADSPNTFDLTLPGCLPNWQTVQSPNPSTSNRLESVAAISANDVWAVGHYFAYAQTPLHTLTMHWDGTAWTHVPSPNPVSGSYLEDVVALASDNVWAVGYAYIGSAKTLIEHWDGVQWNIVPSPNQGPSTNQLMAIDAISPNDIWAAGNTPSSHNTVTMHWDGSAWTIVPSLPNDFMNTYIVGDIVAVASNDVWVVGYYYPESGAHRTFILHWDGTSWTRVPSPNPGWYVSRLFGAVAVSANEIWAVGHYSNNGGSTYQTLVMKWDGTSWSHVPSPDGSVEGYNLLYSITRGADGELWAVGKYLQDNFPTYPANTLILRWDGSSWQMVSSPNGSRFNSELYGIDSAPEGDLWAVGRSFQDYDTPWDTLIMRNECDGLTTPTPTSGAGTTSTPTPTSIPATNIPTQSATSIPTSVATSTQVQPSQTPTCQPVSGTPGPWATSNSMPVPAYGVASASDGTYAYVIGGRSLQSGAQTNRVARFTPPSGAWEVLSPLPSAVYYAPAAYAPVNNRIYVLGGLTASNNSTNMVQIYDIASGSWSTGVPIPNSFGIWGAAAGYHNGKIYLAGGHERTQPNATLRTLYEFDIAANTWSRRADMPVPVERSGYGVINGKFYIAGGLNSDTLNTLYEYDITANTWSRRADMLQAVDSPGSSVVGGKLVLYGGGRVYVPSYSNATQTYDAASNFWTPGPNLNVARTALGGATVDNYLVAMGGYNGVDSLDTTEISDVPLSGCSTPTIGPTVTSTATSISTATPTASSSPTNTSVPPTASITTSPTPPITPPTTLTPSVTASAMASSTPLSGTATPTVCALTFADVRPSQTFYSNIMCLACRGILGGYSDGTFRPNNDITRGQIAKVVSNAAGFNESPGAQIYEDVPSNNTFYAFINRLSMRGHMGGYPCGVVPSEPCGTGNRPYFRPNANATRGQLAKIVASAAQITGTPTGQRYADVEPDSTFYVWIEQLSSLGVMGGYPCGGTGEPCDDQNRPYFHPSNNVTRGQASKIVANTFFPNCNP